MTARRRVVVIGNGMAGIRFVQDALTLDLDRCLDITVIGDEPGGAYNRMQLSLMLAGSVPDDLLMLADPAWYAAQRVALRSGVAATAIDRGERVVRLADGTTVPYDVLVLATGSTAVVPPVEGIADGAGTLRPGVVAFRTLADCRSIDASATAGGFAVVLGAGVLGIEAARALAGRGLAVTLVHRGARLMERQLDVDASAVLGHTLAGLGIDVVLGSGVRAVRNDAADRLEAIVLADGSEVPASLLVLCCGVRPRADLAREAGLEVARGVVVDDRMRSVSDAAVFAIGECAEHRGRTYGLVAPAWEQAHAAATEIVRPDRSVGYVGSTTVTRVKADGVELASLGESTLCDDDHGDGTEVICYRDRHRGVYQKLVVREGRLIGAILLGDTRQVTTLTQLHERGGPVPSDRAGLLVARRSPVPGTDSPWTLPGRATICHCNGVTKAMLCDAWQDGARSLPEIGAATRATTGCGTCRSAVEGIVDWLAAADGDPGPEVAIADACAAIDALT